MKIEKNVAKKPFFVRFLAAQELKDVSGGRPPVTLKFPSDDDEGGTDI